MMNLMTEAARDMPDEHVHVCVCLTERLNIKIHRRTCMHTCSSAETPGSCLSHFSLGVTEISMSVRAATCAHTLLHK